MGPFDTPSDQMHQLECLSFAFHSSAILGSRKDKVRVKSDDVMYARKVPTIVTAHTFCASRDTRFPMGGGY